MRVVAIEEHYGTPELLGTAENSRLPAAARERLLDTGAGRVADMDAAGIDLQVLSLVAPAVQELPAGPAVTAAVNLNNALHDTIIAAHPDRFAGFAALPTGDPDAAATELERAVGQLGLVGTMINGTTGGRFLADPFFAPILETAARLDVPIYLHPGYPPQPVAETYYGGFDPGVGQMLGSAAYGWHYETSLQAVRMVIAGVFDRLPNLKIILGHLGEGIPFHLPRIQDVLTPQLGGRLSKSITEYFRQNFWVTTAGYFYDGPFRLTRETFGDDRVMFSVDYPFGDNRRATDWFARLDLDEETRAKVAHRNVENLLNLPRAGH
jgi:predicted TIM-barrel fold metal-dependent hydrolase